MLRRREVKKHELRHGMIIYIPQIIMNLQKGASEAVSLF